MTTPLSVVLKEGSAFVVLAQYYSITGGVLLKQADLSTITRKVWNVSKGTVVTGHDGATETITSVIKDTPITEATDPRWTVEDTLGYNFVTTISDTALDVGDDQFDLTFTMTDTASNIWKTDAIIIKAQQTY